MPDATVVTGGTSVLPDKFAVNICCANIVARPAVPKTMTDNVAVAILNITTMSTLVSRVGLRKNLVVYNPSMMQKSLTLPRHFYLMKSSTSVVKHPDKVPLI